MVTQKIKLSPIKRVFSILIFISMALFFYLISVRSNNLPIDAYWDAIVAFLGIWSATLIGFGVIFGKSDAAQFDRHFHNVSLLLSSAKNNKRIFEEGILFEMVLNRDNIDGSDIKNLINKINILSANYEAGDPSEIASQREIIEVFNKQKNMALDASIYFQIAIMIGVIGSSIAIGRIIEKKLPSPPVQSILLNKQHQEPFVFSNKIYLDVSGPLLPDYAYSLVLKCFDGNSSFAFYQQKSEMNGVAPLKGTSPTIAPAVEKASIFCRRYEDR